MHFRTFAEVEFFHDLKEQIARYELTALAPHKKPWKTFCDTSSLSCATPSQIFIFGCELSTQVSSHHFILRVLSMVAYRGHASTLARFRSHQRRLAVTKPQNFA